MKRLIPISVVSLVGLVVACGGDDPVDPGVVEVRNADGNPIGGVEVTFGVESGGGTASPTSATTAINGRASSSWTLGPSPPGSIQRMRVSAGSVSVQFTAVTFTKGCKFPIMIELAVGEAMVVDPNEPGGGCLEFGDGQDGDYYRVALVHSGLSEDSTTLSFGRFTVLNPGEEPSSPPAAAAAEPAQPDWSAIFSSAAAQMEPGSGAVPAAIQMASPDISAG